MVFNGCQAGGGNHGYTRPWPPEQLTCAGGGREGSQARQEWTCPGGVAASRGGNPGLGTAPGLLLRTRDRPQT